jgi:hypothetical protein
VTSWQRCRANFRDRVSALRSSAFLLRSRTSASAERRHWSGRAVRWSSCAILLRSAPSARQPWSLLQMVVEHDPEHDHRAGRQADHLPALEHSDNARPLRFLFPCAKRQPATPIRETSVWPPAAAVYQAIALAGCSQRATPWIKINNRKRSDFACRSAVSGARKLRSGADDVPPASGEELRPILRPRIALSGPPHPASEPAMWCGSPSPPKITVRRG